MAKFHEKAVALFACKQNKLGNPVTKNVTETTGTITTATNSTTVTGVGTSFLYGSTGGDNMGELTVGAYIYSPAGVLIGRIASIASQTSATLEANALAALSASDFSVGMGPKNCLAVLELNYEDNIESDSYQYAGDELSRDVITSITDRYCKLNFGIFVPTLGAIAGTNPTLAEMPLHDFMEACRFKVIPSTDGSGKVTYTNSEAVVSYLTIEYRQSSPETTLQKVRVISDARGVADLDSSIGKRPQLKVNMLGNYRGVEDKPRITEDATTFSRQKTFITPVLKKNTLSTVQLAQWGGDNESVPPTYVDGTKNICIQSITNPNFGGFEFDRYLTSCEEDWSVGAMASDTSIMITEQEAGAAFNPDEKLESYFAFFLDWSRDGTSNARIHVELSKLQLVDFSHGMVAKYHGRDLKFKNVGYTTIVLTAAGTGVGSDGVSLKPKYGTSANVLSSNPSGLQTLMASLTDIPGSTENGLDGTFTNTTSAGLYGWVAVTQTAYDTNPGVHFYDGTGYGGWSGADFAGNNTGDSPDPATNSIPIVYQGVNFRLFRQDYINADPSGKDYTLS